MGKVSPFSPEVHVTCASEPLRVSAPLNPVRDNLRACSDEDQRQANPSKNGVAPFGFNGRLIDFFAKRVACSASAHSVRHAVPEQHDYANEAGQQTSDIQIFATSLRNRAADLGPVKRRSRAPDRPE